MAEAVVQNPPEKLDTKLFERCLQILSVGPAKLTIGMFWLNPKQYIACDSNNRKLFERNGINGEIKNLAMYLQLIKDVNAKLGLDYPQISKSAFESAPGAGEPLDATNYKGNKHHHYRDTASRMFVVSRRVLCAASLLSGSSCAHIVLDTADIVRDGDITSTTNRVLF